MGFFGNNDHVSHHEIKKALYHLKDKEGFSDHQIRQVKEIFRGDLDEKGEGSGISRSELKKGIEWIKEHPNQHNLSSHHIEKLESSLGHYI